MADPNGTPTSTSGSLVEGKQPPFDSPKTARIATTSENSKTLGKTILSGR